MTHPYQDPSRPVADRVTDLLARMTLDEKVAQLTQIGVGGLPAEAGAKDALDKELAHGPGVLCVNFCEPLADNAGKIRTAQHYLRTQSRLGIPALVCCEAIHGVMAPGATTYPQALALGATWDPALVREMGVQIARETAAAGVNQVLSPVLDLGRDPRYGRIEECYGECPTLVSRMGNAYITGMQGANAQAGLAPDKVYCMAKHFAGYSIPANGINIAPVLIGEREMRGLHLVPFEAAIREAGVMGVMPSYNAVDGMPSHASRWLLNDLLRDEWGFAGYVYSDWGGIEMNCVHRVAADRAEAARLALEAGVDIDAPTPVCYSLIPELIRTGRLDAALLDRAVARVLRAKFVAGLFDGRRNEGDPEAVKAIIRCPEHVAHARRLAEESIILLKNEAALLPLDAARLRNLAVIGPNADQVQFGDYSWTKSNRHGINVLQALKTELGGRVTIRYAKGCDLAGLSTDGFAEAVAAARASEAAVVVLGDTSIIYSGVGWEDATVPMATVGEGCDVSNPVPPGVQEDLARAVIATGTPTIVVLLNGRPYCIPWLKEHAAAIVEAFYPGEMQGPALVDVLFGKVNPSGRLPVTVAQSAGHIPCTYDFGPYGRGYYHKPGAPGAPGRDYVFDSPDPLWAFGYGLSYTRFSYSGLEIRTPRVAAAGGSLELAFKVANDGDRTGKVVAQVYWRDLVAQVAPPEKRLLRFEKIELRPGETREVSLTVPVGEFRSLTVDGRWIIDPGEIEIQVGDNAEAISLKGVFAIHG